MPKNTIELQITPESVQRAFQFSYDVMALLKNSGFHVLNLHDAIYCVRELCTVANKFEAQLVSKNAEIFN